VTAASHSLAQLSRETVARTSISYKALRLPHHFIDRIEISYRLIIGAKQFPVVGGIFGKNAAADRSRLEAAHDVTVAIGAPN
jgi:hypothetical protein